MPDAKLTDLIGKQSIRATFKLSETAIHTLGIVSRLLGIKQKSLFDQLISDTEALETIAREIKKTKQANWGGNQKTIVISRQTHVILEHIAKNHHIPRDTLVEFSIQRLQPIVEQEKKKLEIRKKIALVIKKQLKQQLLFLKHLQTQLNSDDPVLSKLEQVFGGYQSAYYFVEDAIKKGEKIAEL